MPNGCRSRLPTMCRLGTSKYGSPPPSEVPATRATPSNRIDMSAANHNRSRDTVLPVPTWLYLIRHGVTAGHKEGRMLGQRDIPLDDDGLVQAEAIAGALSGAHLREIVSSPLVRAVQTAEVIGRRRGIDVARDPRLTDLRIGPW